MNTHYSIRSNVLEWVEAGGHEMPTTNQYLLKLNTIHNKSQFKDSWSMIFIKNITLKTGNSYTGAKKNNKKYDEII